MSEVDLFTPIHKAARAVIYAMGRELPPLDLAGEDAGGTLERLEQAMELLQEHHDQEERFIFPPLRAQEPEMIAALEAEHREVGRRLDLTRAAAAEARQLAADEHAAAPAANHAAAAALNRRFNELAAFYLTHLAGEDATLLPATQRHSSDDELLALRAAIQTSQTPERNAEWLSWMLPALDRTELTGLLMGAKQSLPPDALGPILKLAAGVLGPGRWERAVRDAGL